MKITLGQAVTVFSSPIFTVKLPAATAYKFAKLGKLLQQEVHTFETLKATLIKEHNGVLSEDGKLYSFSPDDAPLFGAALDEVLESTVEIGDHFPIRVEALGTSFEMSPLDFINIEPLLVLDAAPEVPHA